MGAVPSSQIVSTARVVYFYSDFRKSVTMYCSSSFWQKSKEIDAHSLAFAALATLLVSAYRVRYPHHR
jgi:adenylate cyclase